MVRRVCFPMSMTTAMQTARLPLSIGPYTATIARVRCGGSGCGGGQPESAGAAYVNRRSTRTQAIRIVAGDEAKNEFVRSGGAEADYMLRQAEKPLSALVAVDDAFAPNGVMLGSKQTSRLVSHCNCPIFVIMRARPEEGATTSRYLE